MEISKIKIGKLEEPLNSPFEISLGVMDKLNSAVVCVETNEGTKGFGEAAPSMFTGDTQSIILESIKAIEESLLGRDIRNYRKISKDLQKRFEFQYTARTAIETAVIDAFTRYKNISMSNLFGGVNRNVKTDITIPITKPEKAGELASTYSGLGFKSLKIKVGSGDDIERLSTICKKAPNCSLKVDANQAFTPKEAVGFSRKLEKMGIDVEIFEQPVDKYDMKGLKFVKENSPYPLAVDESLFSPSDAFCIASKGVADVFNLKIMESGLVPSIDIISIAESAGIDLMIGCMSETSISIMTAASLVSGTNAFSYVDLDSLFFLEKNLIDLEIGPELKAPETYGHGIPHASIEQAVDWI